MANGLINCQEPKGWKKMEHDPSEDMTVDGVRVESYRDGVSLYERFVYPSGRIRWTRLED